MLPSSVHAAVLINLATGAPASPNFPNPLPGPVRAPRGRRIELPASAFEAPLGALHVSAPQTSAPKQRRLH
ncbi:hypothetical protein [Epibacterium ulvae]|uniref:hypothetical protein n=1 Tax=Epibacterium ulvae TaxID=1156985 RepID=UPI002490580B|nr:hypothetical protein [Epibacterium ulvae]